MNILIVEDEKNMAGLLVDGLREESHEVSHAADGLTALRVSGQNTFDLILLDVMLTGMDGLEVTKQLCLRSSNVPVLMFTARDAVPDIVAGLDCGADDYLTKPFSFEELLARVRALERPNASKPKGVLEVEDLC